MEFVDRKEETARLERALSLKEPSLVVIYGRRRLGKSTLVRRVLGDGDLYFLADRSEGRHQRAILARVASELFPDFDKLSYPDWETLFRALNHRANRRFTLCLDEFPYLAEQSPELPSVLQKLVDEKQLKYNLVLCGSSRRMMYGLTLDAAAPLYGRAVEVMGLKPLKLPYIQEALRLNCIEAIEEHSVWGGVPRYWELRENHPSFRQALLHDLFSSNGILFEEPAKLLEDDVKEIAKSATIMSYIDAGANRMSEIASRCNEPATNLSRPLRKLIDLGFLEKEVPFGAEEKNSKKSLYKIADPFMSFYYKFVVPGRSFIELGRLRPIELALEAHFAEHAAMHWEKLCRDAVSGNDIGGATYGKARRWWGTIADSHGKPFQAEFDVVAQSLDGKRLLVGECKWSSGENCDKLSGELTRKARLLPFAKGKEVVPMLFLKNPAKQGRANLLLPDDIISLSR